MSTSREHGQSDGHDGSEEGNREGDIDSAKELLNSANTFLEALQDHLVLDLDAPETADSMSEARESVQTTRKLLSLVEQI